MFRAISCSSSGGQISLIQHLVSSQSVSDRPVHTCAPDGHLLTVTVTGVVLMKFDVLRMSKILLETCRGLYCIKKFFASSWSSAKVLLRWTVSETSKHEPKVKRGKSTSCLCTIDICTWSRKKLRFTI